MDLTNIPSNAPLPVYIVLGLVALQQSLIVTRQICSLIRTLRSEKKVPQRVRPAKAATPKRRSRASEGGAKKGNSVTR